MAAALARVALVDPARPHSYPSCIFLSVTGLECPGCGTTRALHQLMHGNLAKAIDLNVMTVVALPWLAWRFTRWMTGHESGGRPVDHRILYSLAALVVTFGVARNIDVSPFIRLSAAV